MIREFFVVKHKGSGMFLADAFGKASPDLQKAYRFVFARTAEIIKDTKTAVPLAWAVVAVDFDTATGKAREIGNPLSYPIPPQGA